ncbi:Putative virulence factor [Tistlia consotensis]|uniref:Putative virulence factor n=1 Tax=Tistlia consotensis USBA 355 TaxID=560819 RepID=A0A1Y6CQQ3_9PROT|nr:virulence factor SrfC family protein [Tistlia consotensis]SMF66217.1 Putative virulence factor [Tistlia consotensis USBA 355]SNS02562.1 Putative virulence factor [Tistlia consotensis]
MRSKDEALAKGCHAMADAATGALTWFQDNPKTVGARRAGLERRFKKAAVEARKLAQAAERPMSVGVFGASQSGKSFMIGRFIDPSEKPTRILFGSGADTQRLNFLEHVNPVGGDETTGLVTRFSAVPVPPPGPDYPVVLRMLREADLVKILANTFVLDLKGRPDVPVEEEAIAGLFDRLAERTGERVLPGLEVEVVFELEDYVQQELEDHPLNADQGASEAYWQRLERTAPALEPDARAEALAPLWGSIPEFTELYRKLKDALDLLGHPEMAFAPLEAIRDRAKGILHVGTISELDSDGAAGQVTLMTERRTTAALPKPVVSALTAELRITLEHEPWPFFEHTDLLDFPGARSREQGKVAADYLRGENARPTNRSYCYLRGKVAVLFDKYSADLDLNSMLLCSDERNQEVKKLPDLVQRWIARTHGARPADREGKRVALFYCLTKADTLFNLSEGSNADDVVRNRFNKDVKFYQPWISEWLPDRPFDNLFLVRNPKFMRRDLFTYEPAPPGCPESYVPAETGIVADQVERLAAFKRTFVGMELVRRHMADPEGKFDAVLICNDGGISYLVDRLTPTCDPDLKYDQILPRARALSQRMCEDLAEFHEAGDFAERVKERRDRARQVGAALSRRPHLIGQFIAFLQADQAMLGETFMETARGEPGPGRGTDGFGSGASTGAIILDDAFLSDDGPAGSEPAAGADPTDGSLSTRYGIAAVEQWLERLEDYVVGHEELVRSYGVEPEHLSTVVHELRAAARRHGLDRRIADSVQPIVQFHQRPDEHRPRVAMVTGEIINGLVVRLGRDLGDAGGSGTDALVARPMPAVGDFPDLPADGQQMLRTRGQVPGAWLKALLLLAAENAASAGGGLVDVEQNRRLGELIERVVIAVAGH